jgi:YegS/Rv2252/BmrU family lipid kinase
MNAPACLIFNPASGQGDPDQDLHWIHQQLDPHFQLDIIFTTPEKDAAELTKAVLSKPSELVIVAGGDGTISAVVPALISTSKTLGVIPRGTANAFANALGIPDTILGACDGLLNSTVRSIDTATCNGRAMILLAGVGFEAETIERADRATKDQWGVLAYILAGMQQLNQQELFATQIEIAGQRAEFLAGAITIANAAPPTSMLAQGLGAVIPDDGLLEVTIATSDTTLKALDAITDLMAAALSQTPTHREDLICLRTNQITVITHPPQKVVVDGELWGTTPIQVQCLPQSLNVKVPIRA